MKKVIIGIHGLGNKPPENLLRKWWLKSIREGLRKRGIFYFPFKFELVYWASLIHPKPLNPKIKNREDELFLDEPYIPSDKYVKKEDSPFRRKAVDFVRNQFDKIFLNKDYSTNYGFVADFIIHKYFSDLETYYSANLKNKNQVEVSAKKAIRTELIKALQKYRGREILLIAHSMGTIISYDVLNFEIPEFKLDTFVTIGSPLGVPIVLSKIAEEYRAKNISFTKPTTPPPVQRYWYNLSDLRDSVALDYGLASDFEPNANNVAVNDLEVVNDYEICEQQNPHKSFGYLRTPEMSQIIYRFLIRNRARTYLLRILFVNRLMRLISKISDNVPKFSPIKK